MEKSPEHLDQQLRYHVVTTGKTDEEHADADASCTNSGASRVHICPAGNGRRARGCAVVMTSGQVADHLRSNPHALVEVEDISVVGDDGPLVNALVDDVPGRHVTIEGIDLTLSDSLERGFARLLFILAHPEKQQTRADRARRQPPIRPDCTAVSVLATSASEESTGRPE